MTTQEVLRAAVTEVRRGWTQLRLEDENRRVCSLGAIGRVVFGQAYRLDTALVQDTIHALASVLPGRLPAPFFSDLDAIVEWNNAEGRTAEEVALAFEFAALCEEQRAQGVDPGRPQDLGALAVLEV
jgi:hypothetical protein